MKGHKVQQPPSSPFSHLAPPPRDAAPIPLQTTTTMSDLVLDAPPDGSRSMEIRPAPVTRPCKQGGLHALENGAFDESEMLGVQRGLDGDGSR